MSGYLGAAVGEALAVESILIQPQRQIGTVLPDVVVEEDHTDDLVITDHPVEYGANVTDHSFKRPCEVVIRAGWSNSTQFPGVPGASALSGLPFVGAAASVLSGISSTIQAITGNTESYILDVYNALLALQASRQPFNIVTGKRHYTNMLMQSLAVHTDESAEYALMVVARCREIILVQTSVTSVAPQANQGQPQQSAPVINNGTQNPALVAPGNVPPSYLQQGAGGISKFLGL